MSRVCVIGGGPAGAVFAIRMAALGHDVTLVEQAAFPRRRLGEALTPGVRPLLESVGAGAALDGAGGLEISRIRHLWDGPARWRVDPAAAGRAVDRSRLDARLLDCARGAGVEVLQPARIVERGATETGWRIVIATDGGTRHRAADFLADATGRGGRMAAEGPRTLSAYSYWRVEGRLPEPCIEAHDALWLWGVPLPGRIYATLVVCRPETLRTAPGGTLEARLDGLLARARVMPDLTGAARDGPVGVADATPRRAVEPVGDRFIRVGDAALTLDPISSSGVQKAIQGALAGAITAHTLLCRPDRRAAARDFYDSSLHETAMRHRRWAAGHYAAAAASRPHPFWQERASTFVDILPEMDPAPPGPLDAETMRALPVRLSPETRIALRPCLEAEFVALRPAVTHPRLDGPVAFLGGHALAPLLEGFPDGATPVEVARRWADRLPARRALAILARLIDSGVIVPARPDGRRQSP